MATTPSYVGVGTLVATATNAATIQPVPPNGSIGDFLLLVLERNDTTAAPSVTNWTNVAALTSTNGSSSTAVYYRFATSATGSVDQPAAITFGSSTIVRAGVVLRFSGVHQFSPITGTPTLANVASTATTVNATNVTSTQNNTLAVFIATMIGARSTTNTTTNWTAGAGVTAFASQQTTLGNDETIGYGAKTFDTAGSYLTPGIVWTTNTTTGVGQGLLLGLNADGPPPGQSTLDSRRPHGFLARAYRYPVFDANSGNGILPLNLRLRAQVSWLQLEAPDVAAAVTPLPCGQSTQDTIRPAVYRIKQFRYPVYDANSVNPIIPSLLGQDAMAAGDQSTELPPKTARRAVDLLTNIDPSEVWLFGTDAMLTGEQLTELPPKRAPRAVDYTFVESFPLTLVGQDALPTGEQRTELPTPAAQRSRDYTFALPLNVCLATLQQPPPEGKQLTDSLPPRRAPRAVDLLTQIDPSEFWLFGTDAMLVGQQSLALAPSPAPLRARDYSLAESFPLTLIGQDAVTAGEQLTALPPAAPLRARDYTFAPPINLCTLTTVVQQIPDGHQLTDSLPPRAAARARDYTFTNTYTLSLIGQDALPTGEQRLELPPRSAPRATTLSDSGHNLTLGISGDVLPAGTQSTSLPPKRAPRAVDYSHLNRLPNLIGQDTIYGARGEAPSYDYPNPRGPARARDYTWLQTLPLHVYQQLPAGDSTALTESPPKGPLRARDYTYLHLTPTQLIGQDTIHGAPGQVPTYDWQLPTPMPRRMRDYSFIEFANLGDIVERTIAGKHTLSDRALFLHTLTDNQPAYLHTLSDRPLFIHTLADTVTIS
jgi:hypothetical protein